MSTGTQTRKLSPNNAPPPSIKAYLILFAKGFCMGTADVVPGVSGGNDGARFRDL